jgi:peptide/nickel transport system permease protein
MSTAELTAHKSSPKSESLLRRYPTLLPGILLLLIVVLPSLYGQFFVPSNAVRILAGAPNLPPSSQHILGTQAEGRDVFSLLLVGTPGTLRIGLIGGMVGLTIGVILGLISGYLGKWIDAVIRILVDVALTIPALAVLIMIAATFRGLSLAMMGLVIASTSWMQTTRVIRSQVLSLRERGFVQMARLSGVRDLYIIFLEILPNLIPFVAACFVDAVATAILSSIGLEVLGLGSQQNQTLGNTIYFAIYYSAMFRGTWWWWLPPVIILIFIFLGLFLVSMALDEYSNPRLRRNG